MTLNGSYKLLTSLRAINHLYRRISQTVFMLSIAINRAEPVCAAVIIKHNYMLMYNHKIVINIMLCLLTSTRHTVYKLLVYTWTYEKPSTVSQQVFFWTNFIKLKYVVIYIVYYKAIYHPEHSMLYIMNVIQIHNP